ncbi:BatD family protein [Shewanella maritima]|uniref:BatD family protein n=1 Tax=Shewanella maritima TaxID=2520507 RepID=UPI0037369F23
MVIRLIISALIFVSAMFTSISAQAVSQVVASVDRNPAIMGEYFVLTVTADDDLNAGEFNTSMLLADFIVGRTSVGRSTKMVNFDTTKETRWQVLLSPKSTGTVTIPAITIQGASSQPIKLEVAPQGSQVQSQQSVFLKATELDNEAFVGQLMTYKVKLYLAVELQRGAIHAPEIDGAQIKQIGEDKDGTEIVNGRRFRVLERTYGIIADLPGELTIEGASFSGDVLVEAPRRGGMFGFNESRPMQAKTDKQVINIKPAPASFQGDWLVADIVVLQEDWGDEQQEYQVGSPITRTINLIATGSDDNSIPNFAIPLPDSMKAYPEKPQRQSFVRNGQVVSQYQISMAIVPTQAGEFTLPEISVPWWNPRTNKQEYATLPAKQITVEPGQAAPELNLQPINTVQTDTGRYWPWLTALFATLWLMTLGLWLKARNNTPTPQHANSNMVVNQPKDAMLSLTLACKQKDVSQILQQLQLYFTQLHQKPMNLADISKLSTQLNEVIAQLQTAQYAKQTSSIDGANVMAVVKAYQPSVQTSQSHTIAPLNP